MKKPILLFLCFLVSLSGFCQNSGYGYLQNDVPTIPIEKLNSVVSVYDLDPVFCRHLTVPFKEMYLLDHLLNRKRMLLVSLTGQPTMQNPAMDRKTFLQEDFDRIVTYRSVTIAVIQNGKMIKASGASQKLNEQQIQLLRNADLGSEVGVKIRFYYRNEAVKDFGDGNSVKEGEFAIKPVPNNEAMYPGGNDALVAFFSKQVTSRIPASYITRITERATVSFTITEQGQVINPVLAESSKQPKIDEILLDAIRRMPPWKPASDKKGSRMKQSFRFKFGFDGC